MGLGWDEEGKEGQESFGLSIADATLVLSWISFGFNSLPLLLFLSRCPPLPLTPYDHKHSQTVPSTCPLG